MLRTPQIRLTADNKPLSDEIMARLISLTITDNKSGEADEITLTLDDHDSKLALPKRGVILQCYLGFRDMSGDTGLIDMGKYTVDSVEWGGTPDTITIKAKSADMKNSLKQGRNISYHDKTFGQIASDIATRNDLELAMNSDIANIKISHLDQTDESDLNLLTRLSWHYGAVMNIKQGKLLIYRPYQNISVSGQPLDITTITRSKGDSFRYSVEDRTADTDNIQASYTDTKKAKKQTVQTNPNGKKTKALKGNFKDKQSAEQAVHAEKNRIENQQAKFNINLATAYPAVTTESPITLQGFKDEIDNLKWTVEKATHSYSRSQGLTTQLELVATLGTRVEKVATKKRPNQNIKKRKTKVAQKRKQKKQTKHKLDRKTS